MLWSRRLVCLAVCLLLASLSERQSASVLALPSEGTDAHHHDRDRHQPSADGHRGERPQRHVYREDDISPRQSEREPLLHHDIPEHRHHRRTAEYGPSEHSHRHERIREGTVEHHHRDEMHGRESRRASAVDDAPTSYGLSQYHASPESSVGGSSGLRKRWSARMDAMPHLANYGAITADDVPERHGSGDLPYRHLSSHEGTPSLSERRASQGSIRRLQREWRTYSLPIDLSEDTVSEQMQHNRQAQDLFYRPSTALFPLFYGGLTPAQRQYIVFNKIMLSAAFAGTLNGLMSFLLGKLYAKMDVWATPSAMVLDVSMIVLLQQSATWFIDKAITQHHLERGLVAAVSQCRVSPRVAKFIMGVELLLKEAEQGVDLSPQACGSQHMQRLQRKPTWPATGQTIQKAENQATATVELLRAIVLAFLPAVSFSTLFFAFMLYVTGRPVDPSADASALWYNAASAQVLIKSFYGSALAALTTPGTTYLALVKAGLLKAKERAEQCPCVANGNRCPCLSPPSSAPSPPIGHLRRRSQQMEPQHHHHQHDDGAHLV